MCSGRGRRLRTLGISVLAWLLCAAAPNAQAPPALTLEAAFARALEANPTIAAARMRVFGGSINLMSMGGLAVAIGLVIDDAVVVVENIYRRAAAGGADLDAAVGELVAPLVSSTLTTVVVFAPLGLLSGVAGQFFRALSLSLSVAVLLSLGLSITVVPVLAQRAFKHHTPRPETPGRIAALYERYVGFMAARRRSTTIC